MKLNQIFYFIVINLLVINCSNSQDISPSVKTGAENISDYLPMLKDKRIGLMANQSSLVGNTHLVDTLLSLNIHVRKIFSPEHGFRGKGDRGELIQSSVDEKSGLPIISLYASNHKPTIEQMEDIDIFLFDLQDVGVRFYTYISSLHYIMEACAAYNVKLIILDRPNPNGFYVDGPVLDIDHQSFVGMYPIPVVHGMTIGEIATMALGEGWVCPEKDIDITIIPCSSYSHDMKYQLSVKPSPNLPNMRSVYLYPSLCLFEGTKISLGRGTDVPFQIYGHPDMHSYDTVFVPRSISGASKNPVLKGKQCYGKSLLKIPLHEIQKFSLEYLLDAYNQMEQKEDFFTDYFTLLIGNTWLQNDIETGKGLEEIRSKWQMGLQKYLKIRSKYLLYKDFTVL